MRFATPRTLGLFVALAAAVCPAAAAVVDVTYRYDLADFSGTIPYSDARVVVDSARSEVYTVYANEVRVFNDAGMEIYSFFMDPVEGRLLDLAVKEDGDLLLLVYATGSPEDTPRWSLVEADYRGRVTGALDVDLSGDAAGLLPNILLLRNGSIWLTSTEQMRTCAFALDGSLAKSLDLAAIAGLTEEERNGASIGGLDIAPDGTVVFGIPVVFRVTAVSPDGSTRSFGRSGSAAGNFGVLAGLACDREGNLFVADRQRSLVIVFDKDFRFVREFGKTKNREWLIRPGLLAIDAAGRLYVSQIRRMGVAVFTVAYLD